MVSVLFFVFKSINLVNCIDPSIGFSNNLCTFEKKKNPGVPLFLQATIDCLEFKTDSSKIVLHQCEIMIENIFS